jgi:Tfp pilus assembly protein PilF
MAVATDSSVVANFKNTKLDEAGALGGFFERDGKFFVHTAGPDGRPGDFAISYTFGVAPLQQYLVAFSKGRLQALTTAWDSRPAASGGQRWFSLYPDVHSSDDELHWTRPAQNWNYMCADCHSTNVRKNYVAAADSFATTWSEIAVGCEACHGPGSRHLAWATAGARASRDSTMGLTAQLDERRNIAWVANASTGNAVRSRQRTSDRELQVCAQCHSRRREIAEGYVAGKPYFDFYRPALLTSPLYHADGQQRAEVYEWGSFLQSRMNAHGVTCSDCHEPHSGELRAPGAAVCATCHSPAKYDAPAHNHHQAATGVTCLSCHMPAATYMKVDSRRDHSFRVPRPDLSVTLGTPNACSSCHADRGAQWAASQVSAWNGGATPMGFQRFAAAFAAADARSADARRLLSEVAGDTTQPAIARATALAELTASDRDGMNVLANGINDPSPLVRLGVLQGLTLAEPSQRASLATPLLSDSMRAVRIAATQLQAGAAFVSSEQQAAFARASREFVASQQYDADRADARTNLGTFYAELGDLPRAQTELEEAIRLDPFFQPAYVNLADVFRAQQTARDPDAERVLRSGLVKVPASAALHHALGLVLIRLHRLDDARSELQRATQLDSTNVRFGYAYAVALYSTGKAKAAMVALERLLRLDENNRDVLAALASYHKEQGDTTLANRYGDRLRALGGTGDRR